MPFPRGFPILAPSRVGRRRNLLARQASSRNIDVFWILRIDRDVVTRSHRRQTSVNATSCVHIIGNEQLPVLVPSSSGPDCGS